MSAATVEKIVEERVTICDICGGQIEEPGEDSDAVARVASLQGEVKKPLAKTTKVRFSWPTGKMYDRMIQSRKDARAAEQPLPPITYPKYYDFHGECIANLVEAAVKLRTEEKERDDDQEAE